MRNHVSEKQTKPNPPPFEYSCRKALGSSHGSSAVSLSILLYLNTHQAPGTVRASTKLSEFHSLHEPRSLFHSQMRISNSQSVRTFQSHVAVDVETGLHIG